MDIQLQSDGQLYPPRRSVPKPPPPKKESDPHPKPKEPCPPPKATERDAPWEEFLLIGVAFLLLRNSEHPDLPLLIALAYILFDRDFSLKGLL